MREANFSARLAYHWKHEYASCGNANNVYVQHYVSNNKLIETEGMCLHSEYICVLSAFACACVTFVAKSVAN